MSDRKSVCDHCGRSYAGDPLVSLGYVCIWCCTRITDVLAMTVLLYDASGTTTGHDPAALLGAVHVDGSPCSEVAARRRAYIDGIAYEALGGTGEGLNFVRSLEVVEPPAWQAAAGDGEVPIALDLLAHHGYREVREIAPGNCVYVDYGTRAQGFIPLARVWGNGTEFMCELAPEGPATKTLPLNTAYLLANRCRAAAEWGSILAPALQRFEERVTPCRRRAVAGARLPAVGLVCVEVGGILGMSGGPWIGSISAVWRIRPRPTTYS